MYNLWDMFGAKPQVQNLLILATLIINGIYFYRTSKQNTRALNLDINFRAREIRMELFTKLEKNLEAINSLPACDEDYYPQETLSSIFESTSEEAPYWFSIEEVGFVDNLLQEVLSLLKEVEITFPNIEMEILGVNKQLEKLISSWVSGKNEFNRYKKVMNKISKKLLKLMKESLDIKQFASLDCSK